MAKPCKDCQAALEKIRQIKKAGIKLLINDARKILRSPAALMILNKIMNKVEEL